MKYEQAFRRDLGAIEKTLRRILPPAGTHPSVIHEAMRYAVLSGGKRFRPVLTIAACEAAGGSREKALIPAAAVELIHAYSLVHDDLPSMDNDDYRRGKLTVHRKFGEAVAILTGDALLTLAFQILSEFSPPEAAVRLASEISTSAGTYGMIGGQVADLISKDREPDLPTLDYINIHKTGKLIKASVVAGSIAAGAGAVVYRRILRYGEFVGLAFQTADDLCDRDGYLKLVQPKELKQKIRDLIANAKREIKPLGQAAQKLQSLAGFLLERIPRGAIVR